MKAYASRTGTKRNLDGLRDAGWGLLISATGDHRDEGFTDHMLDNGAWTAHQQGKAWDREAFERLLEAYGETAHQTVAPDIVAGGAASLELTRSWLPRLLELPGHVLVAVQDGMTASSVRELLGPRVGVFVGGSTGWKWSSLREVWGPLCAELGTRLHVGRAGSGRMVERCGLAGAYSFDTSEPSRYRVKLPGLDNARRQLPLGELR